MGVNVDTVGVGTQFYLRNHTSSNGFYLRQGKDNQTQNLTGLYNLMEEGLGDRTGIYNELIARDGMARGLYNDVAATGTESSVGISNRVGGKGRRTGMYTYLRDHDDYVSNEPMIGTHTYIYRHHHRPRVYGSLIEIRSYDSDPTHQAYGQYINFIKSNDNGAVSYGVYSRVPEAKDYAGYFVGNVTVTGNFIEASDARLKRDESSIDSPLEVIKKLKPKKYKFKGDNRFSYAADRDHYGFMAQEIEQVMPALVHDINHPPVYEPVEREDGEKIKTKKRQDKVDGVVDTTEIVDIDGEAYRVVHPAETLKGVRYTDLIAVLTGAMQEQQAMIEALGGEVEELRGELAALRECVECGGSTMTPKVGMSRLGEGPLQTSNLVVEGSSVSIYPNPTDGMITIAHPSSKEYSIRILSINGSEMLSLKAISRQTTVDTSGWMPGSYVVEVISEDIIESNSIVVK